jgi:hypothetical protein
MYKDMKYLCKCNVKVVIKIKRNMDYVNIKILKIDVDYVVRDVKKI